MLTSIMVERKKLMEIIKMSRMPEWFRNIFSISSNFKITDEPDKTWKKAEIKEYMSKQGIKYNSGDTKHDLLQKIKWGN